MSTPIQNEGTIFYPVSRSPSVIPRPGDDAPGRTMAGMGMNSYTPLVMVVCLVMFTDFMDTTVMFIAGPCITHDFDIVISDGSWLVMGYELVLCALILPLSRLAKAGHTRRMLVAGLALFAASTTMCAASPSYWILILFRVLQGIGAVLAVSTVPVIIVRMFPEDMQGRVTGAMLTASGAAMVLAPLLGAVLVDAIGWRCVFLINVPVCIVALLLTLRRVPSGEKDKDVRLDAAGTALTVAFIASTLMFLEDAVDGGMLQIAYLAVAVICGIALVRHIRRRGDEGIISLSLVSHREFRLLAASMLLAVMLLEGMLFLTPYFLVGGWGMDMVSAGIYLAIVSVAVVVISIPVGRHCETHGCRSILLAGSLISVAFSAVLALIDESWGIPALVVSLVMMGCAYAIFETAHYLRLIRHVPGPLKDGAATFGTMISFLGASLGVAVFDIVIDLVSMGGDEPGLAALPLGIIDFSNISPEQLTLGFHLCAILCIAMAIIGAVLTLRVRDSGKEGQRRDGHPR